MIISHTTSKEQVGVCDVEHANYWASKGGDGQSEVHPANWDEVHSANWGEVHSTNCRKVPQWYLLHSLWACCTEDVHSMYVLAVKGQEISSHHIDLNLLECFSLSIRQANGVCTCIWELYYININPLTCWIGMLACCCYKAAIKDQPCWNTCWSNIYGATHGG